MGVPHGCMLGPFYFWLVLMTWQILLNPQPSYALMIQFCFALIKLFKICENAKMNFNFSKNGSILIGLL